MYLNIITRITSYMFICQDEIAVFKCKLHISLRNLYLFNKKKNKLNNTF